MKHKTVGSGTAAAALGLVAATLGAGTAQAGSGNVGQPFYRNGHQVAYVLFESRDSGGPERVDVGDTLRDNHFIWTEIYDATTGGRKGTCSAAELTWNDCFVHIAEGHKVRINVYRLDSTDSDFLGELHTSTGALPTA